MLSDPAFTQQLYSSYQRPFTQIVFAYDVLRKSARFLRGTSEGFVVILKFFIWPIKVDHYNYHILLKIGIRRRIIKIRRITLGIIRSLLRRDDKIGCRYAFACHPDEGGIFKVAQYRHNNGYS